MQAHDRRFDGRFFVGVSSTGIYCRPVCTVRLPKPANCTFFRHAAQAESQGFRPCLRCRPELAPDAESQQTATVDSPHRLALAAARRLEESLLQGEDEAALASALGITPRHLRRVFQAEFGVSPRDYVQTQRLLLAKRLLTETTLPAAEIAFASGFPSVRRFNANFLARYRLTPSQLRKALPDGVASAEAHTFLLAYRPPYDWPALLGFLGARAIQGTEEVLTGPDPLYRRIVRLPGLLSASRAESRSDPRMLAANHRAESCLGWVEVRHLAARHLFRIRVSASLAPVLPAVLARAKHLLDLRCQPHLVAEVLGPLAAPRPGLRVPGAFDGFEIAVRAIVGQQVSVAAARTLMGRLTSAFGEPYPTPFAALTHAFPRPETLAAKAPSALSALGILPARAHSIQALAQAVAAGQLHLSPSADVDTTLRALTALPGVGEWTAQYIAMRALAWPDAFPHTDLVLKKALQESSPARMLARSQQWRPWRAYAVLHLWAQQATSSPIPSSLTPSE